MGLGRAKHPADSWQILAVRARDHPSPAGLGNQFRKWGGYVGEATDDGRVRVHSETNTRGKRWSSVPEPFPWCAWGPRFALMLGGTRYVGLFEQPTPTPRRFASFESSNGFSMQKVP